jgi:NAD-dependent dihydropyrimidine dehydrogenase PreA subunit
MALKVKIPFFKPSTLAFLAEARRTKGYSLFEMIHGYIYMRWPYAYIGNAVGERRLGRTAQRLYDWYARKFPPRPVEPRPEKKGITFADTYHGKVIPLQAARELVTVREEVRIAYPEQVIPYALARDLILQQPDHIAVLDCPCRTAREHPCLPLDVCIIVGEPFASVVVEHQAAHARWITQDEAVAIIEAEEARGHVHHAFFKTAVLGRFFAICNCCSCCCGAIHGHFNGTPMLASSGYLSRLDPDRCVGCGVCMENCQFAAIRLDGSLPVIDEQACMGCGICISHCPMGALSLELAPEKGLPMRLDPEQVDGLPPSMNALL